MEGGVVIELPWGKVHIALQRSERREALDLLGESRRHVLLLSPRAPLGRVAKRRFDRRGSGRRILLENSRGNGAVGPVVCLAGTLRTDLGEEGESEVRRESSPQLLDAVFGKSLVVMSDGPSLLYSSTILRSVSASGAPLRRFMSTSSVTSSATLSPSKSVAFDLLSRRSDSRA